eukprot:2416308-Heterocapsa_arctica.AAC.1
MADRTLEDRERAHPEVQMDYMFLDSKLRIVEKSEAWTSILTIDDLDTQTPLSVVLPSRSPDEYATNVVEKYLKRLGHTTFVMKTDGEPAIKQLADLVAQKRLPWKTIVRHTPRYSSASLGAMGVAQELIQGQIRTLKAELEAKYGFAIKPEDCVWPWLVRHAGWIIERFHIKQNGHSAFRNSTGDWYKSDLVPFGETVLFRHAHS